ncbi:MAG: MerR family transcriptional regulator [Flavobacteriales bacterium]
MKTNQTQYTISDLEKYSGIKSHTLRIWEKRYNIFTPQRLSRNRRLYTIEDLKKLLNIVFLNKKGIKISKISNFNSNDINKTVLSRLLESLHYKDEILQLAHACQNLDEKALLTCINTLEDQLASPLNSNQLLDEIMEFFYVNWQLSIIQPTHGIFLNNYLEHVFHHKLYTLKPQNHTKQTPHTFVIFSPENEFFTMRLLHLQYLLKSMGYKTVYLGHSVSTESLKCVSQDKNLLNFVVYSTNQGYTKSFWKMMAEIHSISSVNKHLLSCIKPNITEEEQSPLFFGYNSHIDFIHSFNN